MYITQKQKLNIITTLAVIFLAAFTLCAALLLTAPVSASAAGGDISSESDKSNAVSMTLLPQPTLSLSGYVVTIDNYFDSVFTGEDGYQVEIAMSFRYWSESTPALKYTCDGIGNSLVDLRYVQRERNLVGKYYFYAFNWDTNDDSIESLPSNIVSVTFLRLDLPEVSLTPTGITWAAVSFADEYVVTWSPLDGQAATGASKVTTATFIDLSDILSPALYTGRWRLKVVARSNNLEYYQSSEASVDVRIVKLNTPSLTQADTVLNWNSISGAAFYKIYYNANKYFTTTGTSVDVARIGLLGGSYSFRVAACANGVQVPAPNGDELSAGAPLLFAAPMSASSTVTTGATYWLVQADCRVVFGNTEIEAKSYMYGEIVELPDPTQNGYKFEGWYTDRECTKKFTTNFLTTDTIIYAKWRPLTLWETLGNFFAANWGWFALGGVVAIAVTLIILKKKGVIGG